MREIEVMIKKIKQKELKIVIMTTDTVVAPYRDGVEMFMFMLIVSVWCTNFHWRAVNNSLKNTLK